MQRTARRLLTLITCAALATMTAACNDDKTPAGPDVRGLSLPDAEAALTKAKVGYTLHPTDTAFGIIVEQNFVVCTVHYVSPHQVRLDVAKHGCRS